MMAESDFAVFTFGRFNPPSKGHVLHFQDVMKMAALLGASAMFFISKKIDTEKNPVPVAARIEYIRKALQPFPPKFVPARDLFGVVDSLSDEGVRRAVFAAGSDYFEPAARGMLPRFELYAEKEKGINLESRMSRQREHMISGTELRRAAAENDFHAFRAASPAGMGGVTEHDMLQMFTLTQQGLSAPIRFAKKPQPW